MIPQFLLVFSRLSAMMMALPIISYPIIASRLRILFAFILAVILYPLIPISPEPVSTLSVLIVRVSREILIGLFVGFGAKVIFEAINMAGSFVGRQMGIGIANVMDPTSRQQIPVISQFWALVMITYFFVANGHYLLIQTLFKNFIYIPLSVPAFPSDLGRTVVASGSKAFTIALHLSVPAMVFLLLVDTAIAFTARVMPQMNVFIVTLPLKIGAGIFVLITSIDIFQVLYDSIFQEMDSSIGTIMHYLQGS